MRSRTSYYNQKGCEWSQTSFVTDFPDTGSRCMRSIRFNEHIIVLQQFMSVEAIELYENLIALNEEKNWEKLYAFRKHLDYFKLEMLTK